MDITKGWKKHVPHLCLALQSLCFHETPTATEMKGSKLPVLTTLLKDKNMNTPLRVLIVEDSEDDCLLILRELRKGGYEPLSERVETPEAMRASLRKGCWDLIISDYVLPRFSGLAALDLLKESNQDLPFIIVSGNIGEDIAVDAMRAGAHDYILKGNLTRLTPAVERELREVEVRRERRRAEEALKRSHEELERRVHERTEELRASKAELERLIIEIERSNRDLEQFAYVASHDLQEPLRMVRGFLELLEQRYGALLDDKAGSYIRHAVDGAERMGQLIRDLLLYSRVRRTTWEPGKIDMNEVLQLALQNCSVSIKKSGARVNSDPLPVVRGEKTQLVLLLQNLLVNAVKFRHPVRLPEISITTRRSGEMWDFIVQDNGIGIAREQHERIFMIFQRLHDRRKYKGTGIGLAICRRIIEYHGGQIRVESMPDKGATFIFSLPG
jgi:signal transduction histidine kinase